MKNKWTNKQVGEKTPRKYYTKRMKARKTKNEWLILMIVLGLSLVIILGYMRVDDVPSGITYHNNNITYHNEHIDTLESLSEPHKSFENTMQNEVMALIEEAGLNTYEAYAIIQCESSWNPDVISKLNTNGTQDLGLWQINSIHKDISNIDKLDYIKSTKWAIAKRLNDGHWQAWTCSNK